MLKERIEAVQRDLISVLEDEDRSDTLKFQACEMLLSLPDAGWSA